MFDRNLPQPAQSVFHSHIEDELSIIDRIVAKALGENCFQPLPKKTSIPFTWDGETKSREEK
jgi:hypothetical protein